MRSPARAGNLTAALALVSFLELVLNRLANRLFLPRSLVSGGSTGSSIGTRLLGQSGPFLFHLTNILALLLFVAAFAGLLRRRELYPRAILFAATVIAAVFSGLAIFFFGQQPPPFFFHAATTSYGFLSLLTLVAFLGTRTSWRAKLGVALFTLPGLLHVAALAFERLGWGAGGGVVTDLSWWGASCLLLAAASAPLTLPPGPARERAWIVPGALAAGLTAIFAVALGSHHDLLSAAALFGLHLEMPELGSVMGVAYVAAAFGWTLATTQLVAERGGARLAGYGMVLMAIAGYQIGAPPELTVALIGVLALSVGELRASPAAAEAAAAAGGFVRAADWRTYVGRVAAAATDGSGPAGAPPEAVVVDDEDLEVSRVRGHRRGRPVSLRFLRRRGHVVEFEISVGEPGHQEPQATIERRRGWLARGQGGAPLPPSKTGDPTFDQEFTVRGQAPLGNEGLRHQVMRQGAGVLSLWRGGAARYQAYRNGRSEDERGDPPFAPAFGAAPPVVAHTEDVVAMLDTLIDLVEVGSGSGSGAA